MLFRESAGQALLDEIVGTNNIPSQRACIAAKPRDLGFEHPGKVKFPLEYVSLILAVEADLTQRSRGIGNRVRSIGGKPARIDLFVR